MDNLALTVTGLHFGLINGEAIERGWWWIQPVANATKQMGPGQRQGVLEDQFGFSNWRKIIKMRARPLCLSK